MTGSHQHTKDTADRRSHNDAGRGNGLPLYTTDHDPGGHSPAGGHSHGTGHSHGGGDGHAHGVNPDADRGYLTGALALIVAFMVAEVIVGIIAGSLALISDAGHMLTDAASIVLALWAINLAARPA